MEDASVRKAIRRSTRRGEGSASRLDAALPIVFLAVVLIGVGMYAWDRVQYSAANARAVVAWRSAQPAIAARLDQSAAPEYGAVWSTHKGLICGLVNGWGSFGGLAGMTAFYVWKGRPVFKPDVSSTTFAGPWGECGEDTWIDLVKGSMQQGWCATRQGAKTCKLVG